MLDRGGDGLLPKYNRPDSEGDADIDIPALDAFQRLEIEVTGGYGFCPVMGSLHEVEVWPLPGEGRYGISGSTFQLGDPESRDCIDYNDSFNWVEARPLDQTELSQEDSVELNALVAGFPEDHCVINHFCDPCLQNYVTIDDRTETFSECMEWGLPSECPDAVLELLHFFDPVLFGEQ